MFSPARGLLYSLAGHPFSTFILAVAGAAELFSHNFLPMLIGHCGLSQHTPAAQHFPTYRGGHGKDHTEHLSGGGRGIYNDHS